MHLKSLVGAAALAFWASCALLPGSAAMSQNLYSFDPSSADEQGATIRYFGTAKDDKGTIVSGATIVLEHGNASFIFVTDELGRFRGHLPLDSVPEKTAAACSKSGFTSVRVTKRPGPADGEKSTVQVECVLRRAA